MEVLGFIVLGFLVATALFGLLLLCVLIWVGGINLIVGIIKGEI